MPLHVCGPRSARRATVASRPGSARAANTSLNGTSPLDGSSTSVFTAPTLAPAPRKLFYGPRTVRYSSNSSTRLEQRSTPVSIDVLHRQPRVPLERFPLTDGAGYPTRWRVLPLILVATFMALFDVFVVNVAGPSIKTDLHASNAALQLVVGGYTFTYAAGLVTG